MSTTGREVMGGPNASASFSIRQETADELDAERGAFVAALLQTRTKVLNNELDEVFRRWYPKFRPVAAQPAVPEQKVA
jgi:hypothetical protein